MLSKQSQEVLARVTARNGSSEADAVWLLLRAAAALRQGLVTEDQRLLLHQHLESGDVDLVHAVLLGVGVQNEPAMPLEDWDSEWECGVCFVVQEQLGWRCPSGHRYCSECMRCHVDSVQFPKCPTPGCGYELKERDLQLLSVPAGRVETFREGKLRGAIDALSGATGAADGGANQDVLLRCPNHSCTNAVLVGRERRRYACSCGAAPFCTSCRQPHHYHAACSDIQAVRQQWLQWVTGGREAHFGSARASASFEAQARALREAADRHAELEKDEEWKSRHCRLCPACSRPVQKLEGCSSMVCGTDAHGGNEQQGCGVSFDWSSAPRYKVHVERRERPMVTAEDTRCRGHDTLHAFVDCSLCGSRGQGIVGPRFRCVHCESFDVCKDCEPRLAELHDPSHVFEILFESDFEWGGVRLPEGTRVRLVRRGGVLPTSLAGESPKLEGLCGKIVVKKTEKSSRKRPRETHHIFEWQSDRGHWHRYHPDACAVIADAAEQGARRVQLHVHGTRYMIDLASMQQRNMATGGRRAVRGVADPARTEAATQTKSGSAETYDVALDEGTLVMVPGIHLEPLLKSRAEAESLLDRALSEQEDPAPPQPPSPDVDDEGEEEEECEEDFL